MLFIHGSLTRRPISTAIWTAACLVLLAGCQSATPPTVPSTTGTKPGIRTEFHSDFDNFLRRHVDPSGFIDYAAAQNDSDDLDRYVAWLTKVSPDSHPGLFPTREEALAYWINAYNAWVIRSVLDHYPITSVLDVRPPRWAFFLPRLAGFFLFEKIVLGEKTTSFYALENGLIRKRFGEPRIHFALNCASQSCPRLPQRAFTPEGLEAELTRETRRFVSDREHVRIEPRAGRIAISSIFDWYAGDFEKWMKREHPEAPSTLQGYLAAVLPEPQASQLRDCTGCQTEIIAYDWKLNDRSGSP